MQRDFEAIMSQLHQNRQQQRGGSKPATDATPFTAQDSHNAGPSSHYSVPNHNENSISQLQSSLHDLTQSGGPKEDLLERNLAKSLRFRPNKDSDFSGAQHDSQRSAMPTNLMGSSGPSIPQLPSQTMQQQQSLSTPSTHSQPHQSSQASNINLAALGIDPRVLAGLDSSLLSSLNLFNAAPSNAPAAMDNNYGQQSGY